MTAGSETISSFRSGNTFRILDQPWLGLAIAIYWRSLTAPGRTSMNISPKAKTRSWVYELRIVLQDIRPPIWRLIQIPSTSRLSCLHDALQIVMGWTDSHLHQFEKNGKYWGLPEHFEDDDIDILDERRTEISTIFEAQGDSVVYVYDLGDDWRHEVVLEKILPTLDRTVRPFCLSGERHCPPEDVGGTSGYEEFLEVIFEPRHEEFEHYIKWAEGPSPVNRSAGRFQPEEFNVTAVNNRLSQRRWPGRQWHAATP
jgi:pRiA4b ORF-3-like protein